MLDTIMEGHSSRIEKHPWYSILLFPAALGRGLSISPRSLSPQAPDGLLSLYERTIASLLSGRGSRVPFAKALGVDGVAL
jgi:hypothetical protein